MKKIPPGTLLYHYYYGEMSVTETSGAYITAQMTKPRESWPLPGTHFGAGVITFPAAAVNCWFFEKPEKIGKEKPAAKLTQGQTPAALTPDYAHSHPDFAARPPAKRSHHAKKAPKEAVLAPKEAVLAPKEAVLKTKAAPKEAVLDE